MVITLKNDGAVLMKILILLLKTCASLGVKTLIIPRCTARL